MKTGTDLESQRGHVLHQCACTLDRAPRPVESSEKTIPRRVDFRAVELPQPAANESVMSLEKRTPRRVPELSRTFCGADDVCEEHGRENSIRLLRPAQARQELRGLAHRLLVHLVIDPREEPAQPGQLGDLTCGDSRRDVLRLGAQLRFAENERWHAHRRQDVAHVCFLHRPEKRERCARAEASAHVPDEPLLEGVVVGQAGSPLAQQLGKECALSPAFSHGRKTPTPLLLVRRPRIVRASRSAHGRFEENEPGCALRVRSREQERGPRPLMPGPQHRALRTGCVHHGPHIIHPRLECRSLTNAVGKAGATLVEHQQAREDRQPGGVPYDQRLIPGGQQVAGHAAKPDHVDWAVADYLIGDRDVAASCVLDVRNFHGSSVSSTPGWSHTYLHQRRA